MPQSVKRAAFSAPRVLPDQRCASRNPGRASALDVAPQRAVEQRVPRDAGEQGRPRLDGSTTGSGAIARGGDRRDVLFETEQEIARTGQATSGYVPLADTRKLRLAHHLHRHESLELGEVQRHRLRLP